MRKMTRNEFANKFLKVFCSHIPQKQLKKFHIGTGKKHFLWNVFAGKLVPCFEGDAARKEYDKVDKTCAEEIIYDNCARVTSDAYSSILSQQHLTSRDIDESGLMEFYVVGCDFAWCYVITHEFDLCGPYFCYNPINRTGERAGDDLREP